MNIIANLDRRLVEATTTTEHYLRVKITAPEKSGSGTRLPLNIALIIDRSGSMEGDKLEKAKEAAIFCLRNLTSTDRAAIVAYDSDVTVISSSKLLTPETKNQMIADVRAIQTGGMTNLGGGWLTGAQEVANHIHEANYLSRAIVLSDGLANVGIVEPEQLEHHASELRRRGVSTTTMGIGADFNEDLMERMAIKGGGHFYFIEHANQIPDFMHRELGEVLATVARKVMVEVSLPSGVEATMLNTYEMDRPGSGVRARLDDMMAGESRSVVFKLVVRPGNVGNTLPLPVSLSYDDVLNETSRTVTNSESMLTYATAVECASEIANSSVMEEVALLQAARAREEALVYDSAGDYARSAATLVQAASYVRAAAPASPAAQAEAAALDAEGVQAPTGFAPMKRKEMHYDKSTRQQGRRK
ncbi:MAG: VWA domain-containing protein [Chloroflexota bacterium]